MELTHLIQVLQAISDGMSFEVIVSGQIRLANQDMDTTLHLVDYQKCATPRPTPDPIEIV